MPPEAIHRWLRNLSIISVALIKPHNAGIRVPESSRKIAPPGSASSPRGEPISLIFLHQCDASHPRYRERVGSYAFRSLQYLYKSLSPIYANLSMIKPLSQFHYRHVMFTSPRSNRYKTLSSRRWSINVKDAEFSWHGSEIRETKFTSTPPRWNRRFPRPGDGHGYEI